MNQSINLCLIYSVRSSSEGLSILKGDATELVWHKVIIEPLGSSHTIPTKSNYVCADLVPLCYHHSLQLCQITHSSPLWDSRLLCFPLLPSVAEIYFCTSLVKILSRILYKFCTYLYLVLIDRIIRRFPLCSKSTFSFSFFLSLSLYLSVFLSHLPQHFCK